jgi:hypothetical protein
VPGAEITSRPFFKNQETDLTERSTAERCGSMTGATVFATGYGRFDPVPSPVWENASYTLTMALYHVARAVAA